MAHIPPDLLKTVVFIGYKKSLEEYQFLGSAFWVARSVTDKLGQQHRLAYLVTASHNVEKAHKESVDDSVWLRVNVKGTEHPEWVAGTHAGMFATSRDPNVDLAVLKIPMDNLWDNIAWPLDALVEKDFLDTYDTGDRKIELGDELVFAGLFHPHEGKQRNIPVVRIGNVAALRGEPVFSRDGRPMDLYLIESHSIRGLSGAPVFINIKTAKEVLPPTGGYMAAAYNPRSWESFKLFGIVHGHFGIEDIVEDAVADDGNEKVRINFGISMVIPAEKIIEIIKRFEHEEEIEMEEKARKKTSVLILDSAPTANISFQETGTGISIPVSGKDQFLGDLDKTREPTNS